MTIVRSIGVATLVALMSAHRALTEQHDAESRLLTQADVDAITAYLLPEAEAPRRSCSSGRQRSYN
jgi:hypothetical protein